jgi:hypothetical protein
MAARMYDARDSLKSFYYDDPDGFTRRCQEWQEVIKRVMVEKDLNELNAMLDIMEKLGNKPFAQLWILAATVEMIEPSA